MTFLNAKSNADRGRERAAFLFCLGGRAAEDEQVVPQRHLDLVLVPERLAARLVPAMQS